MIALSDRDFPALPSINASENITQNYIAVIVNENTKLRLLMKMGLKMNWFIFKEIQGQRPMTPSSEIFLLSFPST